MGDHQAGIVSAGSIFFGPSVTYALIISGLSEEAIAKGHHKGGQSSHPGCEDPMDVSLTAEARMYRREFCAMADTNYQ